MNKRILQQAGFGDCPLCKHKVSKDEFRNELSRKEFEIFS